LACLFCESKSVLERVVISIETNYFNQERKNMNCFIRGYLNGIASINSSSCTSNKVERMSFCFNMNLWTEIHPGFMGHNKTCINVWQNDI